MSQRLVYDGDCGFCTTSANWLAATGRVEIVPWQGLDLERVGLTEPDVCSSVWWLEEEHPVERASRAIGRALQQRGSWLGRLLLLRGVHVVADPVYRLVARNRHRLPGATNACRITRD